MQSIEGYGALPMDLHVSPQGYHPYYRKGGPEDTGGQVAVHSRCLQSWAPVQSESILEMRKEKSRDAARSRRGKENYEFYELAKMLPLPAAITSQLDKASIIRLSISYLRLRDFTGHGDPPWSRDGPPPNKTIKGGPVRPRSTAAVSLEIFEQHQGTHILQSLDGFAFALGSDGRFLYISETVSIYLGLSQVEMTGSSVFDYIHQQDHAELAEQLGINLSQSQPLSSPGSVASDDGSSTAGGGPSTPTGLERPAPLMTVNSSSPYKGLGRAFCIRMKSTLTKRGCHFKSSGYRVVLVLCHLRPQYTFSHNRKTPPTLMGMVALAIALPPPSVNEVRLESDMFVTRLTFDFKIAHCEPRVSELLDYTAEELTGKNMYTLCHGQDVQKLRKCHIDLIHKGQVMSHYYRIMNKSGGYTWMQTCATVICNTKNSEEQTIICVNYVLSGIEYKNYVMDCCQFSQTNDLKPDDPNNSEQDSSQDKDGHADDASVNEDEPKTSPKTSGGRERGHSKTQHVRENCRPLPSESIEQPKPLEISVDGLSYADEKQNHRVRKRKLTGDSPSERRSPASSLAPSPAEYMDSKTSPDRTSPGAGDKLPADDASVDDEHRHRWRRPGAAYGDSMSVKDLEDVMNKHLPTGVQDGLAGRATAAQRATIQWIGGSGQTGLPASSLLRQLYVSRESVIRSGSHVVSRPAYYGEVQGTTLPTPPGSSGEAYGAPLDAAPYGVYTGSASGYMDTYSAMTPPASVSPRDKFHTAGIAETAAFSEAASAAAAAAIPHMRHYVADPLQHGLPLKPQVFVHPGMEAAYGQSSNEQQQQLYASSFHLYHPKASSHHHHHNGGTAWYPQPNS